MLPAGLGHGGDTLARKEFSAGYASLVTVGTLFLATGLILAIAEPFLIRMHEECVYVGEWSKRAELEKSALLLLSDLERQTGGDPLKIRYYPLPIYTTIIDSNSRIAINWIKISVLFDSTLGKMFTGGSPKEFQETRSKGNIPANPQAYYLFFDQSTFAECFTLDALLNINTVDESAFESVISQVTGDKTSGAIWRERLRSSRLDGERLDSETECKLWFGTLWDLVSPFVTTIPEWNANTLDPFLLTCVLSCPSFRISDPPASAGAILQARKGKYLTPEDLRNLVGAPSDSPVWAHLGTDSSSWVLRIDNEAGPSLSLWFCRRPASESGSIFRILARRYED
jgi:hypothetical protein